MSGAPWFLLAVGIVIVIVGVFLAVICGPRDSGRIHHKMSDDEIARRLESGSGWLPNLVMLAGFVCVVVSVVWRIVLWFR